MLHLLKKLFISSNMACIKDISGGDNSVPKKNISAHILEKNNFLIQQVIFRITLLIPSRKS